MGPASRRKEVEDEIFNVSMSSYINVRNVFVLSIYMLSKVLEIHLDF